MAEIIFDSDGVPYVVQSGSGAQPIDGVRAVIFNRGAPRGSKVRGEVKDEFQFIVDQALVTKLSNAGYPYDGGVEE